MGSIANEIELMEEVAGWLKNWATEAPQADDISEFIPHRNKLVTINRKIDKVLIYLRFHRLGAAKAIEEKWRGLVNMALADFPNKSDLNEITILSSIGRASYLGDTLHDVAEMARKELKNKEKPNLLIRIISWIFNTTTPLNSENLVYYPEIRSTKSEIRNNIECSKPEFSKQKRLRKLKTCFEFW